MRCVGTLQGPMTAKDIVCASIGMRIQGCTWSAMWSLENKLFVRGSVVLTWLGEYTHTQERDSSYVGLMGVPSTLRFIDILEFGTF